MSTNHILFVFEGEKTEKQIIYNLSQFFLNEQTVITCAYCNNLYEFFEDVSIDDDLDTFSLLKEIAVNKELQDYKRDDFAEIYLFFDYDGHDNKADDSKLEMLLQLFDEETEKGKLYISYPMIESLKHFMDFQSFQYLKVKCKQSIKYKRLVSESCSKELIDFRKYTHEIWKELIIAHLFKMNFIHRDTYIFPDDLSTQKDVFEKQLEKYILVDSTVGVLNALPMFLHDYYGNKTLKEKLRMSEL